MIADRHNTHDPALTCWHVITGAPCSGKTAVIEALARLGHRVVPESARAYIDRLLAQGLTLAQIKANPLCFERSILLEKVRLEAALPSNQIIFMDRAIPDSVAYFRFEGLDSAEPMIHCRTVQYRSIFLLERLEFEHDGVRSENEESAARLEYLLAESYTALGYAIIRVPIMSIAQRTDFVLRHACPQR